MSTLRLGRSGTKLFSSVQGRFMRHVAEDFYRGRSPILSRGGDLIPGEIFLNSGEQYACQAEFKRLLLQILCDYMQTSLHQSCTWTNGL